MLEVILRFVCHPVFVCFVVVKLAMMMDNDHGIAEDGGF